MYDSIRMNREYIKENYSDILNEIPIELDKKEVLPFLYRVYKNYW